jgi:hypothetical protein
MYASAGASLTQAVELHPPVNLHGCKFLPCKLTRM